MTRVGAEPVSGYSVQARISLWIAELVNHGRINLWFSTRLHPADNSPTSRPTWIYAALAEAHQLQAVNYKAKRVLGKLREWVNEMRDNGLLKNEETFVRAIDVINGALGNGGVEPVILFLDQVVGYQREGETDEYQLKNQLIAAEEVVWLVPPAGGQRP